ncbi:MAG: hypothetical protein AB3N07_09485 [Ruegeria sp.]
MSDTIGTYSFLPWLRLGIANSITAADGDASVTLRATIPVDLEITGKPVEGETDLTATVSRNVQMYGPGDIVGIDARSIVKNEPKDWITNFEPNYLPYIEFYEEDFPWRYTPAAPDTNLHRLRPWMALIVLKEDEFGDLPPMGSRPLPAIEVTGDPALAFPPSDQLWAWAHVHVNRDLIRQDGVVSADTPAAVDAARSRFENVLSANPDNAYSRIVAPRRLEADTGYHAFLIPSFETGRLSGLGLTDDLSNAALFATLSAWEDYAGRPAGNQHPYYHRWYFRTGAVGDFEYLVRLLEPRPPDPRLGRRDMDTQNPGSNLPAIAIPELDGVLRLGGALKVPKERLNDDQEQEAEDYEFWADGRFPEDFTDAMARRINLADDYVREGDPDPIITMPLYGRWPSLHDRLRFEPDDSPVPQGDNWVHELNLDPQNRVPAGFGGDVVRKNQEDYMDAAWEQVGDIIEANKRVRLAALAQASSAVWHKTHLSGTNTLSSERFLSIAAPVQRRVVSAGLNLQHQIATSAVPRAVMTAPFRRMLRPRDHVAVQAGFGDPKGPDQLIDRINSGEVSPAPPRQTPEDLPTKEEAVEGVETPGIPNWLADLVNRHPWLRLVLTLLFALLGLMLLVIVPALGIVVLVFAAAVFEVLRRAEAAGELIDAAGEEGNRPEVIDALPNFPDFEIRFPDDGKPDPVSAPGADSAEATRFKLALKDTYTLTSFSADLGTLPPRPPISISGIATATFDAINPEITIPAFTFGGITIPGFLADIQFELFREAMAYPVLDIPMYEPLVGLSDEHFLPNIDKIPPNTITLLETNQKFIEAYMVGANHEMARELLWREYPTDQRGTPFRQFWDPTGAVVRDEGLTGSLSASNTLTTGTPEDRREKLRDIPPLHLWSRFSNLGEHDHREENPGESEEEAVLVIKGELLKRYPNTVIYAQRARWQLTDGEIDATLPRLLEDEGSEAETLRTPLYEARVDPDVTFIGFDLTTAEAQGGTGEDGDDDPGWFFVIKERPGEPRFGLDIEREGSLNLWNDLAWPDVHDPVTDSGFLQITGASPTLVLPAELPEELAGSEDETTPAEIQHAEDIGLRWHPDTNAAELAYILYQVPVLVAVHAREMLPN